MKLEHNVERDAYRFMEAKLDYGKGSGTKRRLVKAEIEKKMEDDNYKAAFNDALMNVDVDGILKKIEARKSMQNAYNGVKKTAKTAYKASVVYSRNKRVFDTILDIIATLVGGRR